jgi:4-hydroxy-4-methyl-2-oxoglutarate aldolase
MNKISTWLTATLASDATEGKGILPNTILPLQYPTQAIGPARVVLVSKDDNLAVRNSMKTPPAAGTVLIVAGGSASRTAIIGGLMALELQIAGIAGLVTDGLVRDAREIRELGFAVWCRGVTPTASHRDGPASVGGSVAIGGIIIRDGDLVIADDDGVVIWPQEQIDELLIKAEARLQSDNQRLAQLRAKK